MPKKQKVDNEFTKASVKLDTKEVLKRIADDEHLYEYELIDKLLRTNYPKYFRGRKNREMMV